VRILNERLMMILNQAQLAEMQDLLGDNFTMLLDIFMRDSKVHIESITEWESKTNNPTVMMAAHTLKSSAGNLGLDELASKCDEIELACNDGNDQTVQGLIKDIDDVYQQSITALAKATTLND